MLFILARMLLFLLFFVMNISSSAQHRRFFQRPQELSGVWRCEPGGNFFSERCRFGRCTIEFRRDKKGVVIFAIDPYWEYHGKRGELVQVISIEVTDPGAKPIVSKVYTFYEGSGTTAKLFGRLSESETYDVFQRKYLSFAKSLEADARELFFGTYGIGKQAK